MQCSRSFTDFTSARENSRTTRVKSVVRQFAGIMLLASPSLVVYFIVHLAMWPAQMTPDSFTQWTYATQSWGMTDLHSGLHVLAMKGLISIWPSPAVVVMAGYIYLALVTGLVLDELRCWGAADWILVIVAVLFPLFPANLFLSTVLWIDIPYSTSVVLCFYFVLLTLRTEGAALKRWPFVLAFAWAIAMVCLLRTNGLIAGALIGLAVSMFYRRFFPGLAVVIVTVAAFKLVIYPAMSIGPFPSSFRGVPPLNIIGAYVAKGRLPPEDDRLFLNTILLLDTMKTSYRCDIDALFFRSDTNRNVIEANVGRLWRIAAQATLKEPSIYISHFICATKLLWVPITPTPTLIGFPPLKIELPYIEFAPVLPGAYNELKQLFDWSTTNGYPRWIFWLPANALYLVLIVSLALVVRRRTWKSVLLAAPAVATTLSIAPLMVIPAYRYQYSVTMMALLLLPLLATRNPSHRIFDSHSQLS
jgi:hypothetical protein